MMTLASLLLLQSAHAVPVLRTICGRYAVDYIDVKSVLPSLDDDYYLDNTSKAARGALVVLTNNVLHVSMPLTLSWDDSIAADTACVTVGVNDDHTYDVKLYSTATVNGITVRIRTTFGGALYVHQGPASWDPSSGSPRIITGIADQWNVAASMGFAAYRRNAGVANEAVDVVIANTGSSNYVGPSVSEIWGINIDDDHAARKYVPAHELGHFLADASNGFLGTNHGGEAFDTALCDDDNLQLPKKVDTSLAAVEGIAYYYAAAAFNNTAQTDCEYGEDADLTLDNLVVPADEEKAPSCEGKGPPAEDWAAQDFMGSHCGGVLIGRGTQIDWLRAFWDADSDQGLTTTQIFDIYADSNPDTWNAQALGNANDPKARMESAATALGLGVQWNAVDDVNGVR